MKLNIKTDPANWDESQITVSGLVVNDCVVNGSKCQISPSQLPAEIYPVWEGMKNMFIQEGDQDGARKCVYATAVKRMSDPLFDEEVRECVVITTHWEWGDGRITPPMSITVEDANVIALVNYLFNPETYHLI